MSSENSTGTIEELLSDFLPFALKRFKINKAPKINFASDPENAQNPLGKTAYYDPASMQVTVYVDGRHPKDIMRSISHELVHHSQNIRGDLASSQSVGEQGYAQNDAHLREMEREAYEQGNLCFRDWEDGYKGRNTNMTAINESRFAATASEEAQKINSQTGIHLNTDQEYWERSGVRTGEELAIEILTGTYNDMYKSVHGFRPRHSFSSVEDVQAAIEALDDERGELDFDAEEDYRKNQELIASLMPNEMDVEYEKMPKRSGMGRAAMQEGEFHTGVPDEDWQNALDTEKYPLQAGELKTDEVAAKLEQAWIESGNDKKNLAFVDGEILDLAMAVVDGEMSYEDAVSEVQQLMEKKEELNMFEKRNIKLNQRLMESFGYKAPVKEGDDWYSDEHETLADKKFADAQAAKNSLQGEDVTIVSGGLAGAAGEVMEMTTSTQGEPAVVVYLRKDADKQVMGKAGDEVIALVSDVEVDRGIQDYDDSDDPEDDYNWVGHRAHYQEQQGELPLEEPTDHDNINHAEQLIADKMPGLVGQFSRQDILHFLNKANKMVAKMKTRPKSPEEYWQVHDQIFLSLINKFHSLEEARLKEGGSMAEYGKIDAEDGNPPSKIGRGNEEYMAAYNAVLQARGEEPLDVQQPDPAYLDALRSGKLEEARPDFMGSDEEKEMMSKMSAKDHYKYVTQDRGRREMSPEEINAIESFNNWLNDENADDYHMRQMTWEPAQSYRGGRVLAYNKKEGTWLDVMSDMPVSDEEMSDILPEAKLQAALKAKLTEVFTKYPQLASNKDFINTIKEGVKSKIMEKQNMKKLNKDFGTLVAEGVAIKIKERYGEEEFGSMFDSYDDDEDEMGMEPSPEDEEIEALLRQYGLDGKGGEADAGSAEAAAAMADMADDADLGRRPEEDELDEAMGEPSMESLIDLMQNDQEFKLLQPFVDKFARYTKSGGSIVSSLEAALPDYVPGKLIQSLISKAQSGAGEADMYESKGNDEDGDGDVDSDDYMAKKDKAIKKSMGEEEDDKKEESLDYGWTNKRNTNLNEALMKWAIK